MALSTFTLMWHHRHHPPPKLFHYHHQLPHTTSLLAALTTTLFALLGIWLSWIPHINETKPYLPFYVWFILLCILSLRFIHVVEHVIEFDSFSELNSTLLCVYTTTFCLSVHLQWRFELFPLLWIMLLRPLVSKYLFEPLFSILLGILPGMNLWTMW